MMFEPPGVVVFIDDDQDLRDANVQALELAGLSVTAFASAAAALDLIGHDFPGIVVTDIRMPRVDGHEVFKRLREIDPDLPVILITGHGDIGEAVQALKDGAYDFVAKPYPAERLTSSVLRALEKRRLVLDNRRLRHLAERVELDPTLIGDTPVMQRLRATVRQIAEADVDVLVEGETGTGKGVVARALHRGGPRRNRPFTAINCAALPDTLVESELFGHEAGAFPGAVRRRVGLIESADRGALFLDEIESLPLAVQGKLLRILDERAVTPLGGNEARGVDIRVIAASQVDLAEAARGGRFRPDLFYRLNVVRIRAPPLRERRDDIPLLFGHFLDASSRRLRRDPPEFTEPIRRRLVDHDWPGNVRELRHFADQVALGLFSAEEDAAADQASLKDSVAAYEEHLLRDVLAATKGDVRATIKALKIPRKTLYDKLRRHKIDVRRYRSAPS